MILLKFMPKNDEYWKIKLMNCYKKLEIHDLLEKPAPLERRTFEGLNTLITSSRKEKNQRGSHGLIGV